MFVKVKNKTFEGENFYPIIIFLEKNEGEFLFPRIFYLDQRMVQIPKKIEAGCENSEMTSVEVLEKEVK